MKVKKEWIIVGAMGLIAFLLWNKAQSMSAMNFEQLWTGLGSTGQYFVLGLIGVLVIVGFFYQEPKRKN